MPINFYETMRSIAYNTIVQIEEYESGRVLNKQTVRKFFDELKSGKNHNVDFWKLYYVAHISVKDEVLVIAITTDKDSL